MQLKKAPLGYVPGCETQHDDIANVMRQVFPGGRVRLTYDKHSGRVEACGECPVTFIVATPPVEDGSDIHALLWRKGEKVKIKRAKK